MNQSVRETIWWLFLVVGGIVAGSGAGRSLHAEEPGLSSVIEKLQVERDGFEDLVTAKLSPGQTQLRETFQGTVKKLEQKLLEIHADPENAVLKADYEETLSSALAQGVHLLNQFSELKGPAEQQLANLSKALAQTREACEAEISASTQRAAQYQSTAKDLETRLADLARRYETLLASNSGALPEDLDFDVQILQVDLDIARRNQQFAELAKADFTQALGDLGDQERELRDLSGALQVMFRQSQGQSLLLKNVALFKERRLAAAKIAGNLARMKQMIGETRGQFAQVQTLVDRLIKHDLTIQRPATKGNAGVAQRTPQAGVDILRSYLKSANPVKEVSDAK